MNNNKNKSEDNPIWDHFIKYSKKKDVLKLIPLVNYQLLIDIANILVSTDLKDREYNKMDLMKFLGKIKKLK